MEEPEVTKDDAAEGAASVSDVAVHQEIKPPMKSDFIDKKTYRMVRPRDFDEKPLTMDGKTLDSILLRKKRPFELQDVDMALVAQGNVGVAIELVHRCSDPQLTQEQAANLDLPCVLEAAGVFKIFFMGTASTNHAS